ncbi:Na(+)-translocating NADH-quinone reductase subunit A [Thiofilum flexile]|uniref:Na(+)-translocating NADH-quinone reductase subunit A n=1 Tax=Thiofilum flexile TaxID=125627 RepID=UPI00037F113F|nr:Na(+)-translocating NADH-quinone reductase subunit A [Thiofilum flexile]
MKISKGLDLPLVGKPEQKIYSHQPTREVAILGRDFHDLRPAMQVQVGDHVKIGQVVFTDRKNPLINFTAPGAGVIKAINRGAQRVLNSVVIELDENEESVEFPAYTPEQLLTLDEQAIRDELQSSGAWIGFRTRPYSKVPAADIKPSAIFVTAMDTRPLAADPAVVIQQYSADFKNGLAVLSRLAPVVYVCYAEGSNIPKVTFDNIRYESFSGPHPAGLPGTHIHYLEPVSDSKTVFYLSAQEVIAMGKLFTTGKVWVERIISLAGPVISKPRLIRTRIGANTNDFVMNELNTKEDCRVISGSVLAGHRAAGNSAYQGRYHEQVSVIKEEQPRLFLHWLNPWLNQFSAINVFLNPKVRHEQFSMTASQNGSHRAMVPIGNYEQVMPLDILPTQLLRSLLVRDTVMAQALGALELDEEDLALCTFVCHSKYEYGPALRECLRMIERGD